MNSERGGAGVVVMGLAAIMGIGMIAVGSLAALYGARVHAGTAADAAALAAAVATYPPAGAGDPLEEAKRYAVINGAVVIECLCPVDPSLRVRKATVIVEIKVPVPIFGVIPIRAGSSAEFAPALWLGR